jgi:GDP-L-fucose synthase
LKFSEYFLHVEDYELWSRIILLINAANCAFPGNLTEYEEEEFWSGKVHQSVLAYGSSRRMIVVFSECYRMQYGIKSNNRLL